MTPRFSPRQRTAGSRAPRHREDGAIAVIAALFAVVMFVLAALVVDLGVARDTQGQAQASADAAALAGVNSLYATNTADVAAAVTQIKNYAEANSGVAQTAWSTCTDPARPAGFVASTQSDCISFKPNLTTPEEIRVYLPLERVKTPFGSLAGTSSVDVNGIAQAKIVPGGKAVCGLCIIGTGAHDFQNGDVTVQNASIYVNGTMDNKNNSTVLVAGAGSKIYLQEACCDAGKGTFSPTPVFGQPAIADPLAWVSLPPDLTGLATKGTSTNACSAAGGPGIYKTLNFGNSCTLAPGLYGVTGTNHYSGQTAVDASAGVTFYFTCQDTTVTTPKPRACNSGEAGGDLLMTGQASLTITGQKTGALKGFSLVSDRNNTAELGFRGNGADKSSGTIYAKSGALDYRGNGAGLSMDSLVVVKDLDFSGNPSNMVLQYNQSTNVELPPGDSGLSY